MHVGIDLDNTIVCYDAVFHAVAVERDLVPAHLPPNKTAVRDHLRAAGREDAWTEMQGHVYGPALERACAFAGVWDFISRARAAGHRVSIVSHKTRHPFRGPAHDLHAAARTWIAGEIRRRGVPLDPAADVFLELTKAAKIARIGTLQCDWFIDDLPEILTDPAFPPGVNRILFDPAGTDLPAFGFPRHASWQGISIALLGSESHLE